ncbi:hypothetical protein IAU60_003961 [Kwoniella sp. DSM 27419]
MDRAFLLAALRNIPAVLLAGAVIRLSLFVLAPALCDALQRRPELSTPLTSFRSLKEGVFIFEQGTDPYRGGVFYHSPLYLYFFRYLVPASAGWATGLLWTATDLVSAVALDRTWKSRGPVGTSERASLAPVLYLFNPYTLLTCLARSTTSIDNTVLLLTIWSAAQGQTILAMFLLAILSHLSLYPMLLLLPVAQLLKRADRSTATGSPLVAPSVFVASFAALTTIICAVSGYSWISRTAGTVLQVTDLTPNVGMWWYFFTEMFDHFRTFFIGVFQLHHLIYVAPLCMRLSDDPLFSMTVLVGIISTWKSYPALGDMALWAGLLSCFPDVVSNLRHPLFTLTVHLYTSILLPLLHSLWLLTGTGNANFFYAATMVYGLNASLAIVDVLGAGLRLQVKRQASEMLLRDELGTGLGQGPSLDLDHLDRVWTHKGWSVAQFTGPVS